MRRNLRRGVAWCGLAWACVWACASQRGNSAERAPPPADPAQAEAWLLQAPQGALACAQCHADRAQVLDGGISPGPPWPGTAAREQLKGSLPRGAVAQAATQCAQRYQHRALTAAQAKAVAAFVASQGPAVTGQPTAYDVAPRTREDVLAILALDGDAWAGEQVFARACVRCHRRGGPGYARSVLSGSVLEVLMKVLGPQPPGDDMPPFTRGTLSGQQARDVAEYLGGQG